MFNERTLIDGTLLTVLVDEKLNYRLRWGSLVEYRNGAKRVRGRESKYEFRSVEQLRYDFERDVEAAGGALR